MPFNSVHFDGTNDWLTRGGGLTGAADSKLLTVTGWIKVAVDGSTDKVLSGNSSLNGGNATSRLDITKLATQRALRFVGKDGSGNVDLLIDSSNNSVEAIDGWINFLLSVDMADINKRHLYINDVSDLNVVAYVNDTLDFTWADAAVGANPSGDNKFNGDIANIWFMPGVYIDFSIEANRRKFIDSVGNAVDLGNDGSIPTGNAPLVFMSGSTDDWHTNKGTGGGFTENGELTDGDPLPGPVSLSGPLNAQSQLTASLRPFRHFGGAVNAVSAVVGLTEVIRDLVSEIASLSTAEGSFQISGTADFIGLLAAQSAGAGGISVDYTLDGGLDSFSALAGSLDKTLPVAGSLSAQSSMTAALLEEFGTITSFEVFKPKPAELQGVYG